MTGVEIEFAPTVGGDFDPPRRLGRNGFGPGKAMTAGAGRNAARMRSRDLAGRRRLADPGLPTITAVFATPTARIWLRNAPS